jgi:tetratricopeptide (TPR) repeat protein
MSESELDNTQPTPPPTDTQPNPVAPAGKKNFPRWLVALVVVLLIVIGILGGYGSGMGQRYAAKNTEDAGHIQEQMTLGLQAMDAGQYEIAKLHFDYVIQHDPNFPGIKAAYADLLNRIQITPTLTPTLTPTITPTPDLRAAEEIYNQAIALLNAPAPSLCERDWDGIISTLDSLRKASATYHTAEVDGMYYIALRSRGVCKIYPQAYQPDTRCTDLNINLEGGSHDLTLAERFGPLDAQADSLRTYARLYNAGASFWDQDWQKAQEFFLQVKSAYPSLADSSCDTATERWRYATIKYAEQILATGDICGAQPYYIDAFTVGSSRNEPYFPTATEIANQCGEGGEGNPSSTETPTQTPTPGPSPTL